MTMANEEVTREEVAALGERVVQFAMLELPGQPQAMHMGTSYLVNDLWRTVRALAASQSSPAADRGQIVEEIKAIVAKDTARATVTSEPWKLCRGRCIKPDIWDALERALSPAPAQTEE